MGNAGANDDQTTEAAQPAADREEVAGHGCHDLLRREKANTARSRAATKAAGVTVEKGITIPVTAPSVNWPAGALRHTLLPQQVLGLFGLPAFYSDS